MVGAGTRKARAISSVESPPSVRSVSATCASGASAGWQHVKIRRSRSSGTGVSSSWSDSGADTAADRGVDSSRCFAISSCFCTKRAPRRSRSIALCRPVDTSHAHGVRGHAGHRPLLERHRERVLERLLGRVHVAEQADERGQDPPVLRPKDLLDARVHQWEGYPTARLRASEGRLLQRSGYFGGPLRIGRTSIEKPASVKGCLATKASASSRLPASRMV